MLYKILYLPTGHFIENFLEDSLTTHSQLIRSKEELQENITHYVENKSILHSYFPAWCELNEITPVILQEHFEIVEAKEN